MQQFLTKTDMAAVAQRRRRPEPSEVFKGNLCLQELTRAELRAIRTAARVDGALVDTDLWNVGIFCTVVIDPATNTPMFSIEDVLGWAERADLWGEVFRIATIGLNFSEVGQEALTKSGSGTDAG